MLYFTERDRQTVDDNYKEFLQNLGDYLKGTTLTFGIEYSKHMIDMLHNGLFSIDGSFVCDTDYKYLPLSNVYSDGVQVMYGRCCCRHASTLFHDELQLLGFDSSLAYVFVDEKDIWHYTAPTSANHVVVYLNEDNEQYVIDPINGFVCIKEEDQNLTMVTCNESSGVDNYKDLSIQNVGKVLKKYYGMQELGIKHVYDYDN